MDWKLVPGASGWLSSFLAKERRELEEAEVLPLLPSRRGGLPLAPGLPSESHHALLLRISLNRSMRSAPTPGRRRMMLQLQNARSRSLKRDMLRARST